MKVDGFKFAILAVSLGVQTVASSRTNNIFNRIFEEAKSDGCSSGVLSYYPPTMAKKFERSNIYVENYVPGISSKITNRVFYDFFYGCKDAKYHQHVNDVLNSAIATSESMFTLEGSDLLQKKRSFIEKILNFLKIMASGKSSVIDVKLLRTFILFHQMVKDALEAVADEIKAREVVQICRLFPDLIMKNYDFVAKIKDFSALTVEDLKACNDPLNHFSLHQMPNALKTLSWEALLHVLAGVEFDLSVKEIALLSSSRGAHDLINSSQFTSDPRTFWILSQLPLAEFAGNESETRTPLASVNAITFHHPALGSLLSTKRIIKAIQDDQYTAKELKSMIAPYMVNTEFGLTVLLSELQRIYVAALSSENIPQAFEEHSEGVFLLLKELMEERLKLTNVLKKKAFKSLQFELLAVPTDSLARKSLLEAVSKPGDYPCFVPVEAISAAQTQSVPANFQIWTTIWKIFIEKYQLASVAAYDTNLIREKYQHPMEHNVIKEWTKYFPQSMSFNRIQSGCAGEFMLLTLLANIDFESNVPNWMIYDAVIRFASNNRLYDHRFARLSGHSAFSQIGFELEVTGAIMNLAQTYFVARQNFFHVYSASEVDQAFAVMIETELALCNILRRTPSNTAAVMLIQSIMERTALFSASSSNGNVIPKSVLTEIWGSDYATDTLNLCFEVIHGLSDYSQAPREVLTGPHFKLDLLSRGLHSVPMDFVQEWIEIRDGYLNSPFRFVENTNSALWKGSSKSKNAASIAPLTLAQSLFMIQLHGDDNARAFLEIARAFPEHLESMIAAGANWAELVQIVLEWEVCWETNFRQFQINLRENLPKQDTILYTSNYFSLLANERKLKQNIVNLLSRFYSEQTERLEPEEREIFESFLDCVATFTGAPERIRYYFQNRSKDPLIKKFPHFTNVIDDLYGITGDMLADSKVYNAHRDSLIKNSKSCLSFMNDLLSLYFMDEKSIHRQLIWNMRFFLLRVVEDPMALTMATDIRIPTQWVINSLETAQVPMQDALLLARTLDHLNADYWEQGAAARDLNYIVQEMSPVEHSAMLKEDLDQRKIRMKERQGLLPTATPTKIADCEGV